MGAVWSELLSDENCRYQGNLQAILQRELSLDLVRLRTTRGKRARPNVVRTKEQGIFEADQRACSTVTARATGTVASHGHRCCDPSHDRLVNLRGCRRSDRVSGAGSFADRGCRFRHCSRTSKTASRSVSFRSCSLVFPRVTPDRARLVLGHAALDRPARERGRHRLARRAAARQATITRPELQAPTRSSTRSSV